VLQASIDRILRELPDEAVVLDIGGWAKPLPRADYVLDYLPYETRGLYDEDTDEIERFTEETWTIHDICGRDPFPFEDDRFDFVVCSHTLEDSRDPVWVCQEIMRVGKAGYIEAPSRLEEQSYAVQGPWVGWSHHHWMVDVVPGGIEFVFKYHVMHGRESDHFPGGFHDSLTDEEKVVTFWWEGAFHVRERFFASPEEMDAYLADFVAGELAERDWPRPEPLSEPPPRRRRWPSLTRGPGG
jgi:Methyltransferase domain